MADTETIINLTTKFTVCMWPLWCYVTENKFA